jgi:hypothetical protein
MTGNMQKGNKIMIMGYYNSMNFLSFVKNVTLISGLVFSVYFALMEDLMVGYI